MKRVDQILGADCTKAGKVFSTRELADELGADPEVLRPSVRYLVEEDRLRLVKKGLYTRVTGHWIHKARLNDGKGLKAAFGRGFNKTTGLPVSL